MPEITDDKKNNMSQGNPSTVHYSTMLSVLNTVSPSSSHSRSRTNLLNTCGVKWLDQTTFRYLISFARSCLEIINMDQLLLNDEYYLEISRLMIISVMFEMKHHDDPKLLSLASPSAGKGRQPNLSTFVLDNVINRMDLSQRIEPMEAHITRANRFRFSNGSLSKTIRFLARLHAASPESSKPVFMAYLKTWNIAFELYGAIDETDNFNDITCRQMFDVCWHMLDWPHTEIQISSLSSDNDKIELVKRFVRTLVPATKKAVRESGGDIKALDALLKATDQTEFWEKCLSTSS